MTNLDENQIPLMTFNSLYNLYRKEKTSKKLEQIQEGFYESLKKFLEDKKEEIEKLKINKISEKLKKERYVLKNSKKISKDLIQIRLLKISNIALSNQILKTDIEEINILEYEKELFEKIKFESKKKITNLNL